MSLSVSGVTREGSTASHGAALALQTPPPGSIVHPAERTDQEYGAGADSVAAGATTAAPAIESPYARKTIYDFQVLDCYHELYDLSRHKGHVVIICNVASKCKEYSEKSYLMLNALHRRFASQGVDILAFPCNQFGFAEPGNEDEIADTVPCLYPKVGAVTFPIMAKVDVNGGHELPLYTFLKSRFRGSLGPSAIKWNFTYFVVDGEGRPVARYPPEVKVEELDDEINRLLCKESTPNCEDEDVPIQGAEVDSSASSAAPLSCPLSSTLRKKESSDCMFSDQGASEFAEAL